MKIQRYYEDLGSYLVPGKVLVIFGPRQVGKSTLIEGYLSRISEKYLLENGDNLKIQNLFARQDLEELLAYVSGYPLLVIDEAQRIPKIGLGLKMIVDHRPDLKVMTTGSSSFSLAGELGEPLTGRQKILQLFPIAQLELARMYNSFELKEKLSEILVTGTYPEVLIQPQRNKRKEHLEELTFSYLLKDILELDRVKSSKVLLDLLRLLAFQVGQEVSLNELGTQTGIDHKTVQRYLDIFEKSFILYNVRGYSRNLRKEVRKKSKYYFYDNGIRNALIANFNEIGLRNDVGALWENFVFMERLKKRHYLGIHANTFFWRTWDKKEIDIIEERDGRLFAYECKYGNEKVKVANDWSVHYPDSEFEVIRRGNYLPFVT